MAKQFLTDIELRNQADIRFHEAATNGSSYVGFQAPASISADVLWTLPATDGANGQVLSTNGSGTLSWTSGGSTTNASDLTAGTLSNARLSGDVMAAVNVTLWSNFR